jgi:sulfatase maturation enzyme AslB (radical SAM superfamily)
MALDHLAVYLTNSCNLACSYCYVAVNQGPPSRLSIEDIRRAVDEFYARVPGNRKITFLGGEPLLDWRLLTEAARYAREKGGPDVVLQTFTNGTLLTPEKLAFFEEVDLHCTISLDGKKDDNDKHRVYFKEPGSVFDDVMRRLEPLDKSRLGVSLVFTSETVDRLLSNIDYFARLGFGRITFNPELYENWPVEKLSVMRAALKGLAKYYRKTLDLKPFQIQILFAVLESRAANAAGIRWWHDCHNMVLGPDAEYYSCDKALSYPVGEGKELRFDAWDERERQLAGMTAEVESRGGGDKEIFCPIGVVAHSKIAGRDPGPALANFRSVADEFAAGLSELTALCEDHPAFQELYVRCRVA